MMIVPEGCPKQKALLKQGFLAEADGRRSPRADDFDIDAAIRLQALDERPAGRDAVALGAGHGLGLALAFGVDAGGINAPRDQIALHRGGAALGRAVLEAWRRGARFDGWTEYFDINRWEEVFRDLDIDAEAVSTGERALDQPLPWDMIDAGVTKEYLATERARAFAGTPTGDCNRGACNACGWNRFTDCADARRGVA